MKKLNKILSIMLSMVLVISTMAITVKADNTAASTTKIWAQTDFNIADNDLSTELNSNNGVPGTGISRILSNQGGTSSAQIKDGAFVYTQSAGTKSHWQNPAYIILSDKITKSTLAAEGYNKVAVEFDLTCNDTSGMADAIFTILNADGGLDNGSTTYFDIRYYGDTGLMKCVGYDGVTPDNGFVNIKNAGTKKIKIVTDLNVAGTNYCSYDVYVDGTKALSATTRSRTGEPAIKRIVIGDMALTSSEIAENTSRSFTIDNLKIYSDDSMKLPDEVVWVETDFNIADNDLSTELNSNNGVPGTGISRILSNKGGTSSAQIKDGAFVYTQSAGTKSNWQNPAYIILSDKITKSTLTDKGFNKVAVEFDLTCNDTSGMADAIFTILNADAGLDNGSTTYFDIRYYGNTGLMKCVGYDGVTPDNGFVNIKNTGTKKIKIVTDLNVAGTNYCSYDVYVDGIKALSTTTRNRTGEPAIKRIIIGDMALTSSEIAANTSRSLTVDNLKIYSSKELDNPTESLYVNAGFNVGDMKFAQDIEGSKIGAVGIGTLTVPTNEKASAEIKDGKLVYTLDGTLTNSDSDARLILPFGEISASADYDKVVVEADITASEVSNGVEDEILTDESAEQEEIDEDAFYNWMFTVRSGIATNNYTADVRWNGTQIKAYGKHSGYTRKFDFSADTQTKLRYVFDLKHDYKTFQLADAKGYYDVYYGDELVGSYVYPRDNAGAKLSSIFFGPWKEFAGTRTFTIDNLKIYSSKEADDKYTKSNDTISSEIHFVTATGEQPSPELEGYDDTYKLRMDIISNFDDDKTFTLIAAYKQNDVIVHVDVVPSNTLKAEAESIFYLPISDEVDAGEYTLELYMWDTLNGMKPLPGGVTKFPVDFNLVKAE